VLGLECGTVCSGDVYMVLTQTDRRLEGFVMWTWKGMDKIS